MKSRRHTRIIEIINEHSVETQDELLNLLHEEGYKVTQATISRDIKDLKLIKTQSQDGKYRYVQTKSKNSFEILTNFTPLFSSSVISINLAQNLIVIKTLSGMAQAICASLDEMNFTEIVGTIAGDDTIFIACKNNEDSKSFCKYLNTLL